MISTAMSDIATTPLAPVSINRASKDVQNGIELENGVEKLKLDGNKGQEGNGNGDADANDEDENDDDEEDAVGVAGGEGKKKKKKKKSNKKKKTVQSEPPRVGLSKIFKDGIYPVGEEVEYANDTTSRITSEEKRYLEKMTHEDPETTYTSIRRAAEVHRQVRSYAQKSIKPGMSMTEIAELIEDGTRALVEEDGMKSGVGFPTGLSVNEVAAHYTPNAGDTKSE